jgi:hypothetical protein
MNQKVIIAEEPPNPAAVGHHNCISISLSALCFTVLYAPYDLVGEPGGKSRLSLCSLQADPDRARARGGREYPPTEDTESVTWWRDRRGHEDAICGREK